MYEIASLNSAITARFSLVSTSNDTRGYSGARMLVLDKQTGQHYLLSEAHAPFSGQEILVFEADADGNVTDWTEVAGGRGISFDDALLDLYDMVSNA